MFWVSKMKEGHIFSGMRYIHVSFQMHTIIIRTLIMIFFNDIFQYLSVIGLYSSGMMYSS